MPIVGLISDTHGLLRPRAIDALSGCDHIVHAGDIGPPLILDRLRQIAPVTAVRGNVDLSWPLPETASLHIEATTLFVIHDLKQLGSVPLGTRFVISGHSHKPVQLEKNGIIYINPGSAGRRRFRLPVTLARLTVDSSFHSIEFIDLDPAATV